MCVAIFVAEGGFKHGGVGPGKGNRQTAAKESCERVLVVSRRFTVQLSRESSGAECARGANLEGNTPRGHKIHGALVPHHRDSVPNAFRAQNFDRFANRFRPADFSRMNQAMHTLAGYVFIDRAKFTGWETEFIAADSIGYNVRRMQVHRDLRDLHRRARAPLPHGIEYPFQANSGNLQRSFPESRVIRRRVLVAPE